MLSGVFCSCLFSFAQFILYFMFIAGTVSYMINHFIVIILFSHYAKEISFRDRIETRKEEAKWNRQGTLLFAITIFKFQFIKSLALFVPKKVLKVLRYVYIKRIRHSNKFLNVKKSNKKYIKILSPVKYVWFSARQGVHNMSFDKHKNSLIRNILRCGWAAKTYDDKYLKEKYMIPVLPLFYIFFCSSAFL